MLRAHDRSKGPRPLAVSYETVAMLLALLWCLLLVADGLFAAAWPRPVRAILLAWAVLAAIIVTGAFLGEWLERFWRRIADPRRRTLAQLLTMLSILVGLEVWVLARSVQSSWSLRRTLWNAGFGLLAFLIAADFVRRWVGQGRCWAPVSHAWHVIQGMVIVSVLVLAVVQISIGW